MYINNSAKNIIFLTIYVSKTKIILKYAQNVKLQLCKFEFGRTNRAVFLASVMEFRVNRLIIKLFICLYVGLGMSLK